jgi:peptide/nickel transport system substrate-binding protein
MAMLFALLAAASGCVREEQRPAVTSTAEESAIPEPGGTVVRRLAQDVNTLNALLQNVEVEEIVLSLIYDPILEIDAEMKFAPGLAESWEISPDGKTYTFRLNRAATWSDGQPVRARDVVFTLLKIVDPATQSAQLAGMFEGLDPKQTRALDDHTVQVVFNQARASQLVAFNIGVLPEHVYRKGSMSRDLNWKAVGSGPYLLSRREAGKEILLTRRSDYWRRPPYIDRVLFKVLQDDAVSWAALKRGDIDESQITSDFWKMERNDPRVRETMEIHRFYTLGYNFIAWNNRDPILSDRSVRRALTMAFDRRKIINNLYYGTARLITGPFTPDQWAYNPEVKPIEFDLPGARQLLQSAGWRDSDNDGVLDRDGKPLEIEVLFQSGNAPSIQQGQVLQSDLKSIGVTLHLAPLDSATLIPRVLGGKYQGVFLAWGLDLDPDLFSIFHSSQHSPSGQNFVFYSNPQVDRLIEQGRVELNQDKRTEIYRRLHAILAEDQPYTWTFQGSEKWGMNRRVRDARAVDALGLFGWYPSTMDWWIPISQQSARKSLGQPR